MASSTDGLTIPSPRYNVMVRGEEFSLSHRQISYDSPNFFTQCFLGDFNEAETRSLSLDTDPALFALIVDYLSGYDILPLDETELPQRMSASRAKRYLAKDAEYLGLTKLCSLLSEPANLEAFQSFTNLSSKTINLKDVLEKNIPDGIRWDAQNNYNLIDHEGQAVLVRAQGTEIFITKRYNSNSLESQASNNIVNRVRSKSSHAQWQFSEDSLYIVHVSTAQLVGGNVVVWGVAHNDAVFEIDEMASALTREITHCLNWGYKSGVDGRVGGMAYRIRDSERVWVDDLWATISRREVFNEDDDHPVNEGYDLRAVKVVAKTRIVAAMRDHVE